jgi:uncharacterized membrane protein
MYVIVAFIWAGRQRAISVNDDLQAGGQYETCKVIAHTVVEVDDKGGSAFPGVSRSVQDVCIGLLAGTILGLIGGPEGLLIWAVLGAVVGSQVDRFRGRPIPLDDLKRLAAQMQPDSSAILTLIDERQAEALVAALAGYEAQVVFLTVGDHVSNDIRQALASPTEPDQPGSAGDETTGAPAPRPEQPSM